jgi:hypothetical protein
VPLSGSEFIRKLIIAPTQNIIKIARQKAISVTKKKISVTKNNISEISFSCHPIIALIKAQV